MVESIKNSDYAHKILAPCANKILSRGEIQQKRGKMLRKCLNLVPSNETETVQEALFYLGFFEIAITTVVDQLIMFLLHVIMIFMFT
jgi:hypothetical protein